MSRSPLRWLHEELPDLVRLGVVDEATAERLRAHYGPPPGRDGRRVVMAVFGVLGALLVGAGVVLVLAHNWEDLSRPLRAGLAFGLLLGAQAIAGWAVLRRRGSAAWTEATSGALALAVVATLSLVSQTYHVAGDPRSMLLSWGLLVAPIPYLTGSRVAAGAVWAIACGWLMSNPRWDEVADLHGFGLLVATTVPFLVFLARRHAGEGRTAVVGWAIALSSAIAVPRIAAAGVDGLWVPMMSGLFGTLFVAGRRLETCGAAARTWTLRPLATAGTVGLAFLIFLLGFREPWEAMGAAEIPGVAGALGFGARAALALALVACAGLGAARALADGDRTAAFLAATPAWAALGWIAALADPSAVPAVVVAAHVAALAVGVAACVEGARAGSLGRANAGLLLIAAVAVARFFDADLPFVVRGVGFIAVGAGFLGLNARLLRRRRVETTS